MIVSTSEQNKAIAGRFLAAFGANDQATLKAVLAPDYAYHHSPDTTFDRETRLHGIDMFNASFSDLHFEIEEQIAEGDMIATRFTWRGTHTGDFHGHSPTGKQVAVSAVATERVKDGKIVDTWFNHDELGLLQQLGLVP